MPDLADELVTHADQVLANALTLADAIRGALPEAGDAVSIIAAGRNYLPFRHGPGLAFAPAKFIGYRSNSPVDHRAGAARRHGTRASRRISRLLGAQPLPDPALERLLADYCREIGADLVGNTHRFWPETKDHTPDVALAILDLDVSEAGNDDPEYRSRMAGSYLRDQRVREAVLVRAGGRCEYCSRKGFRTAGGRRYLETHHVISLSEQGPDRPTNVIALCATHHRRAHFGADWEALQAEFSRIVAAKVQG